MGGVTVKDTLLQPRDEKTAHIKDIAFMSPQWLDMFSHIVAECTRLGLICRCRFGSGRNAGGPWVTPELASQVLGFAQSPIKQRSSTGPIVDVGPVPTSRSNDDQAPGRQEPALQRLAIFRSSLGPSLGETRGISPRRLASSGV